MSKAAEPDAEFERVRKAVADAMMPKPVDEAFFSDKGQRSRVYASLMDAAKPQVRMRGTFVNNSWGARVLRENDALRKADANILAAAMLLITADRRRLAEAVAAVSPEARAIIDGAPLPAMESW